MSENKNAKTPTDDAHVAHVYLFEKNGRPMVAWDKAKDIKLGDRLYVASKQLVGLTDEEIDALSQARSLTDELMDCVDRLGSEADTVDPRVWQHLLVYAPKPEEEPVAWMHNVIEGNVITHIPADIGRHPERWTPLYTAPLKREWVGLTDEQVEDEWERITGHSIFGGDRSEGRAMYISPDEVIEFCRAIEAKLKEKNLG